MAAPLRRRVHAGHTLTNALQTLLTFGLGLTEGGGILRNFSVSNQTASIRQIKVHLVPVGDSASVTNCIYQDQILPMSSTIVEGPWFGQSSDFIQAVLDSNGNVSIRVTAAEEYIAG